MATKPTLQPPEAAEPTPAAPPAAAPAALPAADLPAPAPKPRRIASTPATPEPLPPCGGAWVRAADGALVPQDEATARAAGLAWDAADAAAALNPPSPPSPITQE